MLQLFLVYFGPYYLFKVSTGNIEIGPFNYRFIATVVAFSLNYAAYFAEIFRGGIQSMSKGQYEAATVLGFSKMQTGNLRCRDVYQGFSCCICSGFCHAVHRCRRILLLNESSY